MRIQNNECKQKLIQRLRRIEGQVRGVESMLEEERDCREIMQQLTAIHSAVQSTSRAFFQDYAAVCLSEMDDTAASSRSGSPQAKREQMLQEMISLLDKTP
jgi:CsoR family transcriptional regulator, copper-sensing transcriptional repressor